jgi:16S rRNA (guanine966-N2)-methyltransferase
MLASRIGSFEGLAVADLFAGSGALALEALSRGAARATVVETAAAACRTIGANAAALGAEVQILSLLGAERLPPVAAPFDLILADPPMKPAPEPPWRQAVEQAGWLGARRLAGHRECPRAMRWSPAPFGSTPSAKLAPPA